MKKWRVDYYIRNKCLYTSKIIYAATATEAIKKARVKNIVDLVILEG